MRDTRLNSISLPLPLSPSISLDLPPSLNSFSLPLPTRFSFLSQLYPPPSPQLHLPPSPSRSLALPPPPALIAGTLHTGGKGWIVDY